MWNYGVRLGWDLMEAPELRPWHLEAGTWPFSLTPTCKIGVLMNPTSHSCGEDQTQSCTKVLGTNIFIPDWSLLDAAHILAVTITVALISISITVITTKITVLHGPRLLLPSSLLPRGPWTWGIYTMGYHDSAFLGSWARRTGSFWVWK